MSSALDHFVRYKDEAIERLCELTHRLSLLSQSPNLEQTEELLGKRAELLKKIQEFDKHIGTQVTPKDQKWMNQLEQIANLDKQIQEHLKNCVFHIRQELKRSSYQKSNFLESNCIEKKGYKIHSTA